MSGSDHSLILLCLKLAHPDRNQQDGLRDRKHTTSARHSARAIATRRLKGSLVKSNNLENSKCCQPISIPRRTPSSKVSQKQNRGITRASVTMPCAIIVFYRSLRDYGVLMQSSSPLRTSRPGEHYSRFREWINATSIWLTGLRQR